jgi:hypothetical protein
MSTPYFAGEPASMGRVTALPVATFADLVETVIRPGVPTEMTQADLLALPQKDQNDAKKTRFLVPCSFKSSPSQRQTAHAVAAHLLCLDIDDGDEAARLLKIGFEKLLGDLNVVVWHTARSTPGAPRLRVIVPTAPVPPARYGFAVTALAGLLGMNEVNHESKVPVQPMYLPLAYKDPEFEPVLYAKTDGRDFDPTALEGLEELRGNANAQDGDDDLGDIEYLRQPVEEITRDDIADALTKIPADCSMQQWIEVGMALKHQFGEAGFTLWDDWSASSSEKYPGQEDMAKRWSSMRGQTKDRVPITIRSVIRIATDAGWNNRGVTSRMFDQTRDWLRNAARTSEDLLDQGPKRIARLASVIGPIQTKVLIADLHATTRSRGLRGPTQQDIGKEVNRLSTAALRAASGAPAWASNVVFLTAPNIFYRPLDSRKFRREVIDLIYKSPSQDLSTSQYLIHESGIPVVENLRYDPSQTKRLFTLDGVPYINAYRPTYPKPDPALAAEAERVVRKHMVRLLGTAYWRVGIDWIAYQVQHPGKKIRWVLFVQSAPGAGKGALGYLIEIVLGRTNVQRLAAEFTIESGHNGWAVGSQVTIVDEIRTGIMGNGQAHRQMDKWKTMISDDYISVRNLYEPVQTVPNITNWLMFSNHRDAIAVTKHDRRYCAIASPLQTRAQVLAVGADEYTQLYADIDRLAGGLRYFFENWKISSDFNPNGHAPQTDFLNEMARLTASPLRRAVEEALDDQPHALVRKDLVSVGVLRQMLPRDGLPHFSDQGLANILREDGYVYAGRHVIDGERHNLWALEGVTDVLAKARARVEFL